MMKVLSLTSPLMSLGILHETYETLGFSGHFRELQE